MAVLFKNNATSLVSAPVLSGATSITIREVDADRFPEVPDGDWFPLTLTDSLGNLEIVKVTARAENVMTIVRGQEGTAPSAFPTGARAELRLTAAALAAALAAHVGDFEDGSAAAPSLRFSEDLDTGFFRPATNALGLAVGGVQKMRVGADGVNLSTGIFLFGFRPATTPSYAYGFGPPEEHYSGDTRMRIMSSDTPGVRASLTLENHVTAQPHHVTIAMGSPTTAELGNRFGWGLSGSGIYGLVMEHGAANGAGLYDGHIGILVGASKAIHQLTVGTTETPETTDAVAGFYGAAGAKILVRDRPANIESVLGAYNDGVSVAYGVVGTVSAGDFAIRANDVNAIFVKYTNRFVGIGTDAPTSRLTVGAPETGIASDAVGAFYAAGPGCVLFRDTAANVEASFGSTGSAVALGSRTAHAVLFLVNNTEVARLNSNGNFLVGSTTNVSGSGNINISGDYYCDDLKVLGPRMTGWSVDTGTAKRSANATYTGTAGGAYDQTILQTLMDAVRDATQTIKAIKDDLHATAGQGIFGT